jgi:hypothetical protein
VFADPDQGNATMFGPYTASPLPRALRDVHTARQHLLSAPRHRSELGKVVAGMDVAYPPFVV